MKAMSKANDIIWRLLFGLMLIVGVYLTAHSPFEEGRFLGISLLFLFGVQTAIALEKR